MNPYFAIALGTVALIAAGALYFAGHVVAGVVALVIATVFDVLFVVALRSAPPRRRL